MSDCKLKKYGCTYNETGCSDCKVNQAIQDERERIIEELEEIKRKVYSTYYLSENDIDLGITYGLEKAIKLVRGEK